MYSIINPTSWPTLPPSITDQAYLTLTIDVQVLYESCGEENAEAGTSETPFLLDQGDNDPSIGINFDDEEGE